LDTAAYEYWKNKCGDNFKVATDTFIMSLVAYFGKEGIEIPTEIKFLVDPTGDGVVSLGDFKTFCHLYGPFKESMTNIESLLKHNWFFGSLSSYEASCLLSDQVLGTYLVRFDQQENLESGFVISCVELDADCKVQTLNFKISSKYEEKEKKYRLYYLDLDLPLKSIDQLIVSYGLTFRKPFDNEDYKIKTKQHIANKKDPVTGYRAIENFSHFRGRIHRKFDVKIVDKDLDMDLSAALKIKKKNLLKMKQY